MAETVTPVHAVEINYNCDECGEPMQWSQYTLTSYPPQYPHHCPNKHGKTFYSVKYPRIEYRPIVGTTETEDTKRNTEGQ